MPKVLAALSLIVVLAGNAAAEAKVWKIGYVNWFGPQNRNVVEVLRQGLATLGYNEGRNLEIEAYFTDGDRARTREVLAKLVQEPVDLLVVSATPAIQLAKETTQTIPIVMAASADALATGLVPNLSHPGGNITGLSILAPDLAGKRLQLLRDMRPGLREIAFLASSKDPNAATFIRQTKAAAAQIGIGLSVRPIDGPAGIDEELFDAMQHDRVEAVVVQPIFTSYHKKIVEIATKHRLAVVSDFSDFPEDGGLLSYGVERTWIARRAPYYIDKILKGAKPAELPVEQPTEFQLVINMRAAKALGWAIPESVLLRADRVIE